MERRSQKRDELQSPAEVFARGKLRSVLLVDVSIDGVLIQRPTGLDLEYDELVLVRLYGMPTSAAAHVRWAEGDCVGLAFRRQLHPSLVHFMLNDYSKAKPLLASPVWRSFTGTNSVAA